VTVISRPESKKSVFIPEVFTQKVAYDDIEGLTFALRGQDALIEAFNPAAATHQAAIVRAALKAGVSHLITPDFSTDTFGEHVNEVLIYEPKRKAQRELEEIVSQSNGKLSWTAVMAGAWYDWGIDVGKFWVNKDTKSIIRFGSGNQKYAISRVDYVGEMVVAVLKHPEKYKNRPAYFASHIVTTNQLIKIMSEISDDSEWKVENIPLEGFVENAMELWDRDSKNSVVDRLNTAAYAMLGTVAIFNEENRYNADFGDMLEAGWDEGMASLVMTLKKLLE
jgi:nucleoside-diphosphate-sugar epimerase